MKLTPREQEMETSQLAGWRISGFTSDGWAKEYVLLDLHAWRRADGRWTTAVLQGGFTQHCTHETQAEALSWRPLPAPSAEEVK